MFAAFAGPRAAALAWTSVPTVVTSGQSFAVTGVVRDAAGRTAVGCAGLVVGFSSSGAVLGGQLSAVVQADGTFSATITLTGSGAAAVAAIASGLSSVLSGTISVTGGAGTTDYPNLPAGLTLVSENPWSALLSGATGTQWTQPLGNNLRNDGVFDMSIVSDATAPRSPSNVLRGHFWQGMPGAGGSFQTALALPSDSRTFYTCFWWKTTPYTANGNIHTKQIFLLTSAAILIMQFDALPSSTGMRYSLQMEGGTGNRGVSSNYSGDDRNIYTLDALRPGCFNFNPGVFAGGSANVTGLPYFRDGSNPTGRWNQWCKVEILFVASTAAGNFAGTTLFGGSRTYGDGILQVWVDNALAIDCRDISMGSADVTFNTYIMTNTYGGGFNTAPQAIDWYYDHIYTATSTSRITG